MTDIVHLRGADTLAEILATIDDMRERAANGEITGFVAIGVGPHLGLPRFHALTQGDCDRLIGQMERIKALAIQEAEARS